MNGLIKGKEVHLDDEYLHEKLEDGRVKLIFSYKSEDSEKADLNQTSCHG